ncbi:cysteine peptidase family C39 domain-containing protein, partial [Xanthomonas maliensis]
MTGPIDARRVQPHVADADTDTPRSDRTERLRFWRLRALPNVLQAEAAECGLACLAMIAGYHGHHTDLPALRRRFSLSLKGMTARQLLDVAHTLGLQCRPLRLELQELGQLQTPCILHW